MIDISPTTKAILLLVAPLLAGGQQRPGSLLTPTEYTRLAKSLRQLDCQPEDLLSKKASKLISKLEEDFDRDRLNHLLNRGMQLALALEHWHRSSIHVISRADTTYPQRLKKSLRHRSPSLLYLCGNVELLHGGGLAVVGSRQASADLLAYSRRVGELAAAAKCTIVSGGAKGVDQASMQGAAQSGGQVIGVLPNDLERAVMHRDHRNALMDQDLLLCSPFDPASRFQAWQAMDRNKLIYALSDAALVVQSAKGKGGTWNGAKEQLRKFNCVPVYTRVKGPQSSGLIALRDIGALDWPEPDDAGTFRAAMESAVLTKYPSETPTAPIEPLDGHFRQRDEQPPSETMESPLATELLDKVGDLLAKLLTEKPMSLESIARTLKVGCPQARKWLGHFQNTGNLDRTVRPVQYQWIPISPSLEENQEALGVGKVKLESQTIGAIDKVSSKSRIPRNPANFLGSGSSWATELKTEVNNLLLQMLKHESLSSKTVASHLEVGPGQARTWLSQLVKAGKLKKTTNPVLYQVVSTVRNSENDPNSMTKGAEDSKESSHNLSRQLAMPIQEVETQALPRPDNSKWAAQLREKVEDLILKIVANEALSAACIAKALEASLTQTNSWLGDLVEAGKLTKPSRPIRYERTAPDQQISLL